MAARETTSADEVLRLTDEARVTILELRAEEPDGDNLALWVDVTGTSGTAYTYDLYFQPAGDARPGDAVHTSAEGGDLTVVVPASSIEKLQNATLAVSRQAGGGLAIQNPNVPPPPPALAPPRPAREADLDHPVAQRVLQVLEDQINPSIAAHGGRADLVAVEDEVAYLRLSGGCAGCGMAAVTLSQGIEVAIFAEVPEITRIVDVTDHAAGANPYYEPAKK